MSAPKHRRPTGVYGPMTIRLAPLALFLLVLLPVEAHAARVDARTRMVSAAPGGSQGGSTRPAISSDGRRVAFDSDAPDLTADPNGTLRDVFVRERAGRVRLVSVGRHGAAANGPSSHAAVGGRTVVFQSEASNLVTGDGNATRDVFARDPARGTVLVSVAADGGPANGPSSTPDVSSDGRMVAFVSGASNLVAGDANGVDDVFVRDLQLGTTVRVGAGDGRARAPAISPDGRFVSFASQASDLVAGDTNGQADVFLADLRLGRITRVSVSSRGRQQNDAVIAPFAQISDVSRGGRHVVFDSDADNLVRGDTNRDTDVFVRDVRRRRTVRVSRDMVGRQGDNDSFAPSISAGGRFVAFASFAENLAAGDARREDVFVYDRRLRAPTTLSVGHRGQRRGRERVDQLLQRPVIAENGRRAAFTSTAGNLVPRDRNRGEDVFLRDLSPPAGRIVAGPEPREFSRFTLRLQADDPRSREFICALDGRRFPCGVRQYLPAPRLGRHTLVIRAGGPGMLFDPTPVRRRFVSVLD